MMPQPELPEPEQQPDNSVYEWRYEQLLDAGYPPEVALLLADSDADLHKACDYLASGCDPQTALYLLT